MHSPESLMNSCGLKALVNYFDEEIIRFLFITQIINKWILSCIYLHLSRWITMLSKLLLTSTRDLNISELKVAHNVSVRYTKFLHTKSSIPSWNPNDSQSIAPISGCFWIQLTLEPNHGNSFLFFFVWSFINGLIVISCDDEKVLQIKN